MIDKITIHKTENKIVSNFSIMPEGPEVRVVTDKLQILVGHYLSAINWDDKSKYRNGLDNFELIVHHLPLRIEEIHCKGKQIFFRLSNSSPLLDSDTDTSHLSNTPRLDYSPVECFYLNITLGMEGKLLHSPGNHSNMIFNLCQEYGISNNQTIITINSRKLYYDDSRHFGNIFIFNYEQYMNKLSLIGPDLLVDDIDPTVWLAKARNVRIKKKQICDYLMEQKYFSGIGNYLKSEILYAAGIKPDRSMSDIKDEEFLNILTEAQRIIRESYQANGLTIRSYIDPTGNPGKYQQLIYNKDIDSNGYTIVRSKFKDDRTTFWVPELQH